MYTRNIPGCYYPIGSPVHKLNVIVKLINFLIYLIVIIFSKSLPLHLFMSVLIILEIILSNVPLRFYFNMFYSTRYLYVLLIIIFATIGLNLENSILYLLKIIMTFEYLSLIIYTSSPSELNYGIVRVLNPINFLNVNLNKVSNIILNIINFIPVLVSTEQKILKSQASRGLDYFYSGIVGKIYAVGNTIPNILRLTNKRIKETKQMSELRMFNIKYKRTNLNVNKIGFNDISLLLFHILFLTAYIFEVNLI